MQQADLAAPHPVTIEDARITRLLPALALALVTIGAAVPLTMMIHGSITAGIEYYWWTWPAIPAAWLPAVAGAILMRRHEATGSLLLLTGAGAGVALFWHEHAIATFGPAWLIGAYTYLDAGRRRGWLSNSRRNRARGN